MELDRHRSDATNRFDVLILSVRVKIRFGRTWEGEEREALRRIVSQFEKRGFLSFAPPSPWVFDWV
jgi:hypothetical protein